MNQYQINFISFGREPHKVAFKVIETSNITKRHFEKILAIQQRIFMHLTIKEAIYRK